MMLEPLEGCRAVDLFAGSGALGIEAISRGASWVDFVEPDRAARAALEANLEALEVGSRSRVWSVVLPGGLGRLRSALEAADLVLMDPPYGGEAARQVLSVLGTRGRLALNTKVAVEHHAKDLLPERAGDLVRERSRRYGETAVTFYGASPGGVDRGEQDA